MAYTFEQIFAADPSTPENVATNGLVIIFAPGDAAQTPLTITTVDGLALANPIRVNDAGYGPAFMHATLDRVAWAGGGFTGFFTSYDGMKEEAVAARVAAQAAALEAGAPTDAMVERGIQRADIPGKVAGAIADGPIMAGVVAGYLATPGSAPKTVLDGLLAPLIPTNKARPVGQGELVLNMRDLGVRGDGVTDDTPIIQAIFNTLPGTFGGARRTLFFPEGTYKHSGLTIENRNNFELTGPGRFVANNTTNEYIKIKNCDNFKLLGIDSSHANSMLRRVSPARAISLESSTNFEVRGCHAHHNEGVGIMMVHCSYGVVAGNKIDNTLADGIGLYGDTHHVTVSGNVTFETGDDGIAQVGVTTQGVRPHHNTIFGNTVEHSHARGIVVVGAYSTTVVGNTVNSTRAGGIYVAHESSRDTYGNSDVIVANNTINDANTYKPTINQAGIFIFGGDPANPVENITVTGNIIRNSRTIGMNIGGAAAGTSRVSISDNRIIGTGQNGITVLSVSDITLRNNFLYSLGGYGIFAGSGVVGTLVVTGNLVRTPNTNGSTFAAIGTKEAVNASVTVIADNIVVDASTSVHGISATASAHMYGNQTGGLPFEGGYEGQFELTGNLNITSRSARANTGGGRGVLAMRDAAAAPSTNPANGGVIFIEAGALKYKGSNGTVTVIAPA